MPELPDVLAYLTALERGIGGRVIEGIQLRSPFLVRSVGPRLQAAEGLRVLAFRDDVEEAEVVSANVAAESISLEPQDDICRYRITLPEWMVEPGK